MSGGDVMNSVIVYFVNCNLLFALCCNAHLDDYHSEIKVSVRRNEIFTAI